jgi:hypothetical protein
MNHLEIEIDALRSVIRHQARLLEEYEAKLGLPVPPTVQNSNWPYCGPEVNAV